MTSISNRTEREAMEGREDGKSGRRCRNEGTLFRAHNDNGTWTILHVEANRRQGSPPARRPFVTESREVSLVWCTAMRKRPGKRFRRKNIRADFVTVSRNPELGDGDGGRAGAP